MYKRFKINYKLSKDMYDKYKGVVEVKGCYCNVATILMKMGDSRIMGDVKIVFGAWQVPLSGGDNIFARHCFFLNGDDIVDLTYFAAISDKDNDNRDYMIFKTLTVEEYLDYLAKADWDTSLSRFTEKMFRQITVKLMEENIILIG